MKNLADFKLPCSTCVRNHKSIGILTGATITALAVQTHRRTQQQGNLVRNATANYNRPHNIKSANKYDLLQLTK